MDSMSAFTMGEANRGKPLMVFDWDKAADLINERRPQTAGAGLANDWDGTGGQIYRDGKPVPHGESYTYLASTWATPELCMDGEYVDCWTWAGDTPGWNADTYWPESAVARLSA